MNELPIPDLVLSGVRTKPEQKEGSPRKLLRALDNDDYLLEIDNSSFESFQTCDRLSFYKLILGRTPLRRYALTYGGIIHKFLEHFYSAKLAQTSFDLEAALVECEALFTEDPPPDGEWRTYDKFDRMMRKYVHKYTNEDTFEVLSVEKPFAVPIAEFPINQYLPYPRTLLVKEAVAEVETEKRFFVRRIYVSWTGVIDLRVLENGQKWVVDHKTTSIEGPQFWQQFELSQQLIGYTWAAEKIDNDTYHGAIVNAIYDRPDTKSGKGRAEENPLLRRHIYYKRHLIDQWQENTRQLLEDFIHDLTTQRFPMKTTWCVGKYGVCPFNIVCTLPEELRPGMLATDQFTTNVWNPLDS